MNRLSKSRKEALKYVVSINDETLSEDTELDVEIKYVDIGNVNSTGQIQEIVTYRFADAPSRARRIVRQGDVIISTVRTYLKAIAPIENPPNNLIVSTGFAVVRPCQDKLDTGYCKYVLRESEFLHEVISRSVGISYPAINASDLGNIPISYPPLPEQKAIASYLDEKTAKIDELITTKKQLLELLAEKRRALITHAVTRGLNSDVLMRDSGIEWLGDIPEHWNVEYAKWLLKEVDERSITGEEELLTVSHITGITPRSQKEVNMFMAESLEGYKICQSGDLVINTLWAWMGAMGTAFEPGIVSPSYHVYRPYNKLIPAYLDYLVRISDFTKEATRYSKGVWSSRLRLYPDEFFKILLPVPPLQEQKEIVKYLHLETQKLDNLRLATEQAIKLLEERRTALITEAVTGQIQITA